MHQDKNNDINKKTNQELYEESYEKVRDFEDKTVEENTNQPKNTTQTLDDVLSIFEFSNPKLEVLENAKLLYRQFKIYHLKKDKHTRNLILSETERDLFSVIKNIAKANSVNLFARPKSRRNWQEDAVETLSTLSTMFGIYLGEKALSSHEFAVLSTILSKTLNSLKAWVISDYKRYLQQAKNTQK